MDNQTPRKSMFITPDGQNMVLTFALVTSLFFVWGFCNGMIDTMDKHFQEVLHLNLAQSAWVQFAHFLGYAIMSLPAGMLASKLGYKGGIIMGLLLVAVGGFWFIPATHIAQFWAFLLGVCIVAAGLTFLETVANPYTTVLGDQQYGSTRINLAQSCNSIGSFFGPIAGSMFFYSKNAAGESTGSQLLYVPYAGVAVVVILLAVAFVFANVPDIKTEDDYHLDDSTPNASHSIWSHPHFVMSVVAQFFYVAAQVGIFSFFINYMTGTVTGNISHSSQVPVMPATWGASMETFATHAGFLHGWLTGWFEPVNGGGVQFSDKGGSNLAAVAMLCFMAGRFSGAYFLRKAAAHSMLGLYGLVNTFVCLLIFLKLGWLSVACVFVSYFFMSIMFPTIFALGIHGLGVRSKKASAFIVMAILGGAILPKAMGFIADKTDLSRGFIMPMICFAVVAYYGFKWPKFAKTEGVRGMSPLAEH
jgi:FHS family L-fucose permease-like MFS transporter